MVDELRGSEGIYRRAVDRFDPRLVVLMFSGGRDSLAAYYVARELGIRIDYIIHGRTGTGIRETTEYCREFAEREGMRYLEGDAGDAYEEYVMRKGFFGLGRTAHSYAYHILKAGVFRRVIASVRQRRRNFNVLMLNGARSSESSNRGKNIVEEWNVDPGARTNIWVNILLHWGRWERDNFLEGCGARINPVTERLCRSGECLCGTMQSQEERREAAFWYPEWGEWIDGLERRVRERGFDWGWGESMPRGEKRKPKSEFQPACHTCQLSLFGER